MKARSKVGVAVSLIVAFVVLRASTPFIIEYYLNERLLPDLGDYSGSVEDIDLALWRVAFRIEGLRVEKAVGKDQVDFLIAPVIEVSLSRRALMNGAIRAKAFLDRLQVNFVDAENPRDRQSGRGLNWQVLPEDFLKFTLEELEVRQAKIAFRNFTSDPPVNLQATEIDLTATNLTNVADKEGKRVADAEVAANLFDGSPLAFKARFDPFNFKSFLFAGDIVVKDLAKINNFAQAYGNLDFKSGQGQILVELEADQGKLTGYIKPLFENVQIADWQQDVERQEDNPFRLIWESVTGLVNKIFTNPQSDKFATRIEISGDISDTKVNTWGAIFGIVRNAFAEAINSNFDQLTPLDTSDIDAGTETPEDPAKTDKKREEKDK
jgi:hypothetical protein